MLLDPECEWKGRPHYMDKSVAKTVDRKTRRRNRTRQQLIDAVQAVILQHGYDGTSADSVTEMADLGRSTFYNHFESKQDAVLAMLTSHFREYGEAAYVPLEETHDRALSVTYSTLRVFKAMASDPLTRQLIERPRMLAKAIAESQGEYVVKDFAEGIKQKRFKFAIEPQSLAVALNWSYVGMLISAIQQDTVETMALDWARFLLTNLGLDQLEIEGLIWSAHNLGSELSP